MKLGFSRALAAVQRAQKATAEQLTSATAIGEFVVLRQDQGDDQPKLWTKAKIRIYFDHGKYHIQLDYEKILVQVDRRQD